MTKGGVEMEVIALLIVVAIVFFMIGYGKDEK